MNWSAQLILAIVSAAFSVLLTAIVSYIAWRMRGVLSDINDNTEFRRMMTGSERYERDGGELREIDSQFDRMRVKRQREHEEVREHLDELSEGMAYLTEFVRRLGRAFNRSDLDESVTEPEEFEPPSRWRRGRSEEDD